ncbi:hypothetical protein [Acinetobacter sp. MD2]|uniref:hypothetical protein n=1 Tax=Acinetobacter sp. MD2 TaxID=2600066 RepID=UPI002D1EE1B7|nr:hypothetical protein [Acinetobacter sp. MD2]MEB3766331.1 hypothetical protein [Acinetobacter sp. MD2]
MFKVIEHLNLFKAKFSFAYFVHYLVVFIIVGVFSFAYVLLLSPIQSAQYIQIQQFSLMGQYPQTQSLAKSLLEQSAINKQQYFRLLRAFQYEQQGIQQYPALDPQRRVR